MDDPATAPKPRVIAAVGVAQAAVYAVLAFEAAGRWPLATAALGVAAAAQAIGALLGRDRRARMAAGAVSLAVVGLLVGLHLQAMIHVIRAFHPDGTQTAWEAIGVALLALPWVAVVPIWQVRSGGAMAVASVLIAVPVAWGLAAGRADRTYDVDGAAVAAWVRDRVNGTAGAAPDGGPAKLVVSLVDEGEVTGREVLEGDLPDALGRLSLRRRGAVIVEVAVAEGPVARSWLGGTALARPGEDEIVKDAPIGARATWQDPGVAWPMPGLAVPAPRGRGTRWIRYEGWLASAEGVVRLDRGWAEAPALDADRVAGAALDGARMLARNMNGGRFAYVVEGPSGDFGKGYNFPRHAGATWFLAMSARRDASLRDATSAALGFLREHTTVDGDRAWVRDPDRDDGRVWVGTTSLALLALLEADGPSAEAARYAAFVASSVDADGRVRGDFDLASGAFPAQPEVTYAQGQALLALAVAHRQGVPGLEDALVRAAGWSDRGYRPGGPLHSLDDHWGCIAAEAVTEALGHPAGLAACDAWLATVSDLPVPGAPLQPAAGPAGAVAEAWVARAEISRKTNERGPWESIALDYGRLFLAQQYRPDEAPLLVRPDRLVGGFRDRPWSLDVRMDSVQHIGCALWGLERLVREEGESGDIR